MNNSVDHTDDSVPVSVETGGLSTVGASLKAARIKKNIRLDEAAKRLRLGTDVVHAIENGLENELPGIAFTRGYVRSYAKLLGMDEGQVLSDLGGVTDDIKIHLTQNKPIHYRKQYPVGKWLLWVALVAVVAGLIFLAIPVIERLLSSDPDSQSDKPRLIIPGQSNTGTSLPLTTISSAEDSSSISDSKPDSAPSVRPEPTISSEASNVTVATPSQNKELVLTVRQDCWVEVKFGGKKHLAGILKSGQKKVFETTPPVEVLLGNAPAVTVEYGGKEFNHSIYTKGKVARFSLGR